ncbi:P-loop containing nucleoside triphosphate hydrolase protein [Mariannaea sp. PMI_226]|nr:P-loop containing nucleoside triphosphate hydrolase protein [Mariannaea sp. PMI_226]
MALQLSDEKVQICTSFLLEHLYKHQNNHHGPLVIGLNGMQGVGKTTLVASLAESLNRDGIYTVAFSIDDFYLTREDQVKLSGENADNALFQHRGQPGTHDVELAKSVLASLVSGQFTKVPAYDKALFSGQGDRLPEQDWTVIDNSCLKPLQIVILEGWSVGFRSLAPEQVAAKWNATSRTLKNHKLEHLLFLNEKLRLYEAIWELFGAFIQIDAEDAEYVYAWRQEQEELLRISRGDELAGMTPMQVKRFVDGFYPGYELYTDGLRDGWNPRGSNNQLRIIVGRDRGVQQISRL